RRRAMMQTLLRDRFKLTFHAEKREMPIYALIVPRADKRLGEGLRKTAEGACLPRGAGLPAAPSTPGPPPAPPSPFDPNAEAPCGSIIFGPGRLLAHGVPIDMLANSLGSLPAIQCRSCRSGARRRASPVHSAARTTRPQARPTSIHRRGVGC